MQLIRRTSLFGSVVTNATEARLPRFSGGIFECCPFLATPFARGFGFGSSGKTTSSNDPTLPIVSPVSDLDSTAMIKMMIEIIQKECGRVTMTGVGKIFGIQVFQSIPYPNVK